MSQREQLKRVLDRVRSLPGKLDRRLWDVSVVVTLWSGAEEGDGYKSTIITPILVDGYRPRVKELSQKDTLGSGGLYQDQDLSVRFTQQFNTGTHSGGYDIKVFDPDYYPGVASVSFLVKGPGYPDGAIFQKVSQRIVSSLSYELVLRKTGRSGSIL